jgi:hypothetical protein
MGLLGYFAGAPNLMRHCLSDGDDSVFVVAIVIIIAMIAAADQVRGETLIEPPGPWLSSYREASSKTIAGSATAGPGQHSSPGDGSREWGGLDGYAKAHCLSGLENQSCSMSTIMFNTIASFIAECTTMLQVELESLMDFTATRIRISMRSTAAIGP